MKPTNSDGEIPRPTKTVVDPPDILLQIHGCLDSATETKITGKLHQQLVMASVKDPSSGQTVKPFPNPVVLPLCIANSERIGIWRQPSATLPMMTKALGQVDLLAGATGFVLQLSPTFMNFIASQVFSIMPKRQGDITLTDMFVTTGGPSNVVTHVTGSASREFHDIRFEHTITDRLDTTNDRRLIAISSQDTTSNAEDVAADVLLGLLAGGLGPMGFAALGNE